MAIGTKDVKEALWSQLDKLRKLETKTKDERELTVKESDMVLKVTGQLTEVLKVELHAMEILSKQDGVKLGNTTAAHFGVIDNT